MATDDPTEPPSSRPSEIVLQDLRDHLRRGVGLAALSLLEQADTLHGLGGTLGTLGDIPAAGSGEELTRRAATLRALAMEVQAVAAGTLALAERLRAYGGVRSILLPASSLTNS